MAGPTPLPKHPQCAPIGDRVELQVRGGAAGLHHRASGLGAIACGWNAERWPQLPGRAKALARAFVPARASVCELGPGRGRTEEARTMVTLG